MVALLIENSKLIMIFLLIGTIIGLAYFGNRPLGDEDRQAPWNEEGDRGTGPPIGRRHARIWVDGTTFHWTRDAVAA